MSKEFTPSINVPETARFGPPNAQFYFRSVAELIANPIPQIITEPQSKPSVQTGGEMNEIDAIKEQAAKEECINLTGKPCPDEPESKPALPKTDTIFTRDGELISKTIDSPKIEKPVSEKNEPNNATITNDDIEQKHLNKTYEGAYRDGDEQMPMDQEQRIVGELSNQALENAVPPRQYAPAEIMGIGIALASGVAVYAGRARIGRLKERVAKTISKTYNSIIDGALDYGLELERIIDAATGSPHYFASKIIKRRIEKGMRYETVMSAWEDSDMDDLKWISSHSPKGVKLARDSIRVIRDLHKKGKPANLPVVTYLLSHGDMGDPVNVENPHAIDIGRDNERNVILNMNGRRYSTNETVETIIQKIQLEKEERAVETPHSIVDRLQDLIHPTVK